MSEIIGWDLGIEDKGFYVEGYYTDDGELIVTDVKEAAND